jgi:hypothetical protein
MASLDAPLLSGIPDDLVQAVAYQAARDAEIVCLFLRHLGIQPSLRGEGIVPVRLPSSLLLGLAGGLRLYLWENNGARAALPVELPNAGEAIGNLMIAAADPGQTDRLNAIAHDLAFRVFRAWVDHFAWHGRATWDADVLLGQAEETLLDELADFLWENRHALQAQPGENA